MHAAWTPERIVSVEEAAQLVGTAFPDLAGRPVRHLEDGWDDTVHVVDESWAFHFPRRTVAVDLARREVAWLPRLAPLLPLAVPVPQYVGDMPGPAGAPHPWPYWGGRLLAGEELAYAGVPDGARGAAGRDVGGFLRVLHGPAVAAVVGDVLAVDPMGRGDPAVRVPLARSWLDPLTQAGAWAGDPAVERLLADAERLGPARDDLVVSHGDLHLRHLLLEKGRVSGVIDWGDMCLADPCVDLSVAYGAFVGDDRDQLLAAYGTPVPADRELRARVLAVMLCAALAEHARTHGSATLLAEAVLGIGRAAC